MEYKAKRHSVLESLRKDLALGALTTELTIKGYKFKLTTLNEDEETWADTFMRTSSPAAMYTSRRAPRLAASVKTINDMPVDELFTFPDDMPKQVKDRLLENGIEKRFWVRDQVLMFLLEESNRGFITELYEALSKLDDQREQGAKELPNS